MRRKVICGSVAALLLSLSACSLLGPDLQYETDYANHEPLHVFGYPSTGSLQVVQEVVWRIADGKAGDLEKLATSDSTDSETRKTAANWIKSFQKGATGKVAADFYDEASERQVVVLYFQDTRQVKEINVRPDGLAGEDGWRVLMNETSLKEATSAPTWAPKEPGGDGSVSTG
ncbi:MULTISPECIES: hypothetical protein [unclassified Streptomyces]|uniref:hypothetical protein n=1 Tax=unclassified Streptomyces TaxID=2593676 RepID=UPI002251F2B7|nr:MULTISPECIES: hypothetical protein [unclassified Streptomyces]WSP59169.1 hypothetical protein OG306_35920 [Streptomyces sp. NBC_01241]MCX4790919.1 hypothetical protein [Streptomyces sp. NBC_01221]MCX4793354.1 hypothetical protein [Streptomyces sp. NBC_01242]WSJ34795.1 hypothetical protein OG772_01090 [Streptomyces sp. NBC_01321]WSP61237.1 hypothetical protein OG466_04510 [Streptomyces sp. NBC_01240]